MAVTRTQFISIEPSARETFPKSDHKCKKNLHVDKNIEKVVSFHRNNQSVNLITQETLKNECL